MESGVRMMRWALGMCACMHCRAGSEYVAEKASICAVLRAQQAVGAMRAVRCMAESGVARPGRPASHLQKQCIRAGSVASRLLDRRSSYSMPRPCGRHPGVCSQLLARGQLSTCLLAGRTDRMSCMSSWNAGCISWSASSRITMRMWLVGRALAARSALTLPGVPMTTWHGLHTTCSVRHTELC